MKNLTQIFVEELSDDIKIQMIKDYELFEERGMIGDCELRSQAERLMERMHIDNHVVMWMEQLAKECFRYFAHKYLEAML